MGNIEWLKQKQEETRSNYERCNTEYQHAVTVLEKARKTFNLWTQAIIQAMKDAGMDPESEEKETELIPKGTLRARPSIADLTEEVIKGKEPLSTKEIQHILENKGKTVNMNVLNVTLNRHRPQRFDRDTNNKWFAVCSGIGDGGGMS